MFFTVIVCSDSTIQTLIISFKFKLVLVVRTDWHSQKSGLVTVCLYNEVYFKLFVLLLLVLMSKFGAEPRIRTVRLIHTSISVVLVVLDLWTMHALPLSMNLIGTAKP